jgi:acetylornithine deacetylase/succinyl-diaminopimelate desuccinylase-like protein
MSGNRGARWAAVIRPALVLMAISTAAVCGVVPLGTPNPLDGSAPPMQFSSARALEHVRMVAGAPRPMGSPQNDAARTYLLEQLSGLGLHAEVQEVTTARLGDDGLIAGRPRNVLARLEGTTEGDKAVMLVAHYDSVPTGPGASDDGAGVAAMLETLRALKAGPPLKNDVIFLFTEGEERGLLGARLH